MKKKILKTKILAALSAILVSLCMFVWGVGGLYAQQGTVAAGGVATGTGGTATYSTGLVSYITATGSSGIINQGLQQAAGGKFIPGRIEAESWDTKSGPQYAIPSTDAGGGQQVVGISNGSWMDYNVTVTQSGAYTVNFRVATTQNNAQFQIKLGATILGTINIPNTGGWSNWVTVPVSNIPLAAGVQTIRIQSTNNETCNFNWTDWILTSVKVIPGRIEAESFDVKNGQQYAIPSTDAGGGQQVVGITNGSWMDYNVTVLATGTYRVDFRIATTQNFAQFQIKLGATVLGTVNIPNTGGWNTWQTVSVNNIALTAGVQTIRIQSTNNETCNFNWMDWVSTCIIPDVAQPSNQTVCNNAATTAVTFTGSVSGTGFNWTNNNPSIGLAVGGSGDIPSFTATNTTNAPVTATITVTPSTGGFAYIPNNSSSNVSVINTATNAVVATIPGSPGPWGISVSPDGSRVYVSNAGNKTVSVINTATNTVVATIALDIFSSPGGVAVSPDGSRVYIATRFNLSVINTATNTAAIYNIGGSGHYDVSVSPDGSRAYVANRETNDVSVINTATMATVATVSMANSPIGIKVSPDGSRVYVANGDISVINTATNTVVANIPIGGSPWGLSFSPDGSRLYVSGNSSNNLSVINTATNSVVATIPVGDRASGVSVTSDGSRVYVANRGSGNVSVISTATNTVVATIPVGSEPVGFSNFITGNVCTGATKTFTITVNPTCGKVIPGRIEAEDFDAKNGPLYAVPSTDAGGGQQVVGINNGSWMDYNVTVLTSGTYRVNFRVATTQNFARFQIKLGATVLGTINIPNTGSWSNWQTVSVDNIALTAGVKTIRIQSTSNETCNFNWTDWTLMAPPVTMVNKQPAIAATDQMDIAANKLAVSIFPNPANDYFNLKVQSKSMDQLVIKVTDMAGRKVQQLQGIPGQTLRFGENMKSGTYFIQVWQGLERIVTKVVKQ